MTFPKSFLLSLGLHLLLIGSILVADAFDFFSSQSPLLPGGDGKSGTVTIDLISDFHIQQRGSLQSPLRNRLFDRLSGQPIDSLRSRPADHQRPSSSGTPKASLNEPGNPPLSSKYENSRTARSGSGLEGNDPLLGQIRARIERAKHYPELAQKSGIQGKALVHFQINDRGLAQDIILKVSSGSQILDQESLETIRRAGPYPEYPGSLEVWIHFSKNQ